MRTAYVIEGGEDQVFKEYYKLLNNFIDLTPVEISIISQLVYHYFQTEGAKEKIRWQWTFSTDTRQQIRETLDMSTNNFNTNLTNLRKKMFDGEPVIQKTGGYESIHPKLIIKPGTLNGGQQGFQVLLNFYITSKEVVEEQPPVESVVEDPKLETPVLEGSSAAVEVSDAPVKERIQEIVENAYKAKRDDQQGGQEVQLDLDGGGENLEDPVPPSKKNNGGRRPARRSKDLRPQSFHDIDPTKAGEVRTKPQEDTGH